MGYTAILRGHQAWQSLWRSLTIAGAGWLLVVMLGIIASGPAAAQSRLGEFLRQIEPGALVPGADHYGPAEGSPPVAAAFAGNELKGWVWLNTDFVGANGYSGKPIHVLAGIALDGTLTGARLVDHKEPIVLIGIPQERIAAFINGYVGHKADELVARSAGGPPVDIVSGATVTVMVIADSLIRSAARVAQLKGLSGAQPATAAAAPSVVRTLDTSSGTAADWATLIGDGSIRSLTLTVGEVSDAFQRVGRGRAAGRPESQNPEATFIELYTALASVPAIGRSLLGDAAYTALARRLKPGQHAVLIAANGAYSFKGSGYVRGGIFDRIELVQGAETIRFRDKNHSRIADLAAAGAPRFREIGLFTIPEDVRFDPVEPWRLQLLAQRQVGALERAFLTFDLGYSLPARYVKEDRPAITAQPPPDRAETASGPDTVATPAAAPALAETPLWQRLWRAKLVPLAIVAGLIGVLTLIYFFQHPLVRRPILFDRLRLVFLAFILVWLGWIAHAQLSVVNVLTFTNSLLTGFSWDAFLVDPLIFVLWFSVAAALLFWGRGPFCGWLCPFGALQELANRGARLIKLPQIRVPWGLHERLWPIKYIIFLVLFGVSLYSLALAEQLSEVEPFKTAIVLHFAREWWFVAFAGGLLTASLFIERFFCRYLCPLGAALAIPGRMRMFDWLRRYRECGNPCQRCANECPVQAIHPEGHINPNECIGCLHCQVLYHHDQKCPVVIQRRIKREKRAALMSTSMRPGGGSRDAARAADSAEVAPS
jgi:NosR/NirI family nitrous oxide reductase transcriptional regulator